MGVLISVFTVIFVVLCILLIIIILLQSDKSAGMGILGSSSQSAFGSSTADIITKITAVMIGLFMIGSLGIAVLESQRVSKQEKKYSEIEKGPEKSNENKDTADQPRGGSETRTPQSSK